MTRFARSRFALAAGAVALALAGAVSVVASDAASAGTSGTVHVWVTPGKGAVDQIMLSGAIGDHGTATSEDKNGKVDPNGAYVKVALQQGGFEVNATVFNRKADSQPPTTEKATCSAWATVSGPVTLYNGTGAYAGISGTVHITTNFAFLAPRFKSGAKSGQCNMANNATPVAEFDGDIIGSGRISY